MALTHRQPAPGLIHHSDRGSQYASHEYRQRLAAHGIVCSMSRRGDCWDNAMAESLIKTIKTEVGRQFLSRSLAERELFEYIEGFYNTRRLHSGLGYRTPAEVERLTGPNLHLGEGLPGAVAVPALAGSATAAPTLT